MTSSALVFRYQLYNSESISPEFHPIEDIVLLCTQEQQHADLYDENEKRGSVDKNGIFSIHPPYIEVFQEAGDRFVQYDNLPLN